MLNTMQTIVRPGFEKGMLQDPDFPHAPPDWSRDIALAQARAVKLVLTEDHWQLIRALQDFYARHEESGIHVRELHDALDECFHAKGGLRHMFTLFPEGPIAQGCRLAGLEPPAGVHDPGFGSVS
jgi:TusE/DsrC/DsvC family sulfur relay protein